MRWIENFFHFGGGPALAVPLVLLMLFLISLWREPRGRERNRGSTEQCRKCGYDLTGNVSGRCPECGLQIITAEDE